VTSTRTVTIGAVNPAANAARKTNTVSHAGNVIVHRLVFHTAGRLQSFGVALARTERGRNGPFDPANFVEVEPSPAAIMPTFQTVHLTDAAETISVLDLRSQFIELLLKAQVALLVGLSDLSGSNSHEAITIEGYSVTKLIRSGEFRSVDDGKILGLLRTTLTHLVE
jgi:hypothetical protein